MSSATPLLQLLNNPAWDLEEIENFLTQDSSYVNDADRFNFTPLWIVLTDKKCSIDMVRLLLRFGADVNCMYHVSYPPLPLHAAIGFGDESIVRVLLEAGADVNALGYLKNPALCVALQRGRGASINLIKLLLELVDVNTYSCSAHGSVMHCAMRAPRSKSKEDVVQLLIDAGADVNKRVWEQSPMCIALQIRPVARDIEHLLDVGFSLSECRRHKSPFFCATELYSGNILTADVVKLLLKANASFVKIVDEHDSTPLQCVLKDITAKTNALRLLFDVYNIPPNNVKGPWGSSLLALAFQNRHQNLNYVKFLMKQGAKVESVNDFGNTALHLAVRNHNSIFVKFLLKNFSLNVNSGNGYGKTPLRVAVQYKAPFNVFQLLLAAGARVEDNKPDPLLKVFLTRYKYDIPHYNYYVGLLIRYSLLENPDFDIQGLIQGHKDYQILSQFETDCKRELQRMEMKIVGQGQSLLEFISERFSPQGEAPQDDPVNYGTFNQLLEVIAEDEFPIYFEAISIRVHRSWMETKLEEILFYTVKRECVQKKVVLDYVSVCEIAKHSSDDELLRLIFAFYNASDNAHMRHRNISKMNPEGKRRHKESAKFPKRPKL